MIESLETIAPDVGRYILEFAFGDIYNKDTLSFREREIVTITSLLTQGDTKNQLMVHMIVTIIFSQAIDIPLST